MNDPEKILNSCKSGRLDKTVQFKISEASKSDVEIMAQLKREESTYLKNI